MALTMLVWFFFGSIQAGVAWSTVDQAYGVGKTSAGIRLVHTDYRDPMFAGTLPLKSGFHGFYRMQDDYPLTLLASATTYDKQGPMKTILVANWLIVAIYAACWIGCMMWWQRRKQICARL